MYMIIIFLGEKAIADGEFNTMEEVLEYIETIPKKYAYKVLGRSDGVLFRYGI